MEQGDRSRIAITAIAGTEANKRELEHFRVAPTEKQKRAELVAA